jgi:DivIVA domain-containing protein
MPAARLDHPVLMSAEQIRRREFVTTRRGYDPDQVRGYLVEVADQIDVMASMIREARMEAEAAMTSASARPAPPTPQEDPYERLATRVASVIREADATADRLRVEGTREAERVLGEARQDADRIRLDAQASAEQARADAQRTLEQARERADRTVSGLASRRQAVVDQLAEMQERLLGVARELESTIEIAPNLGELAGLEADAARAETNGTPSANGAPESRGPGDRAVPPAPAIVTLEDAGDLDDPAYEDLWDGTEAIRLEVPDIPPLDLSWGADDEDGRNGSA